MQTSIFFSFRKANEEVVVEDQTSLQSDVLAVQCYSAGGSSETLTLSRSAF